ncbi:bacillithiol biosynthesis cysteine-adding enzyme BshC [Psychroserpens sp.]|uniref:bacillithiol biosynthesis cysteine-adding enzyme BshC n=1 Tax=Psychroserpens sp. TaxID=2020870 RepID=UPI001B037DDC|nr:bacillithiol biosynthesis cysteine-adding enzyme BshC [Psychroserpens sp.]MBO6606905.1 bacillithiol biosynthesis cysteine-adding enzyme BshC [Psychroserpens sp.]MBO6631200.1 bacillithiol biosynthesis cysteine-adding enzyme BshC [Psychroserpens sp.]MBO6654051.1 bacillithiol biosynthesis cysteine-adding enzyme BshC [Psychroserpens sp.]MBO6682663.1 bacillithiol biosynthesis cysteine-adding enzyme BshC [Psychroserpens sp.]MBO6750677.1 bacillithiol biosynthesis cysteine-adding enzyme BshC [Psych
MPTDYIPFRKTNYFSSLICDYLDEKEELKNFYHRFPNLENFKMQIEEKQEVFSDASRSILVESLKAQYASFDISEDTKLNIDSLNDSKTFTITTGHQLNLFTGPLYFFYKIVSTINLCKALKVAYPEFNFVPIYWMATEDHDFDEINFFNFQGKKVQWNRNASGAVGELELKGLDHLLSVFEAQLDGTIFSQKLVELFGKAYLSHSNLADAMRHLVNELFGAYGLVIIDGNNKELKRSFIPYIKDELFTKTSFEHVSTSNLALNQVDGNYKIQVNPRDINLFYINDNLRERIVENQGNYRVNGTDIIWTKAQLGEEVDAHPERFSPNVIVRPLYQEIILPNLCYIGGGGELAYWFQLKSNFESQKVVFPMLLLRNSVLLMSDKQQEKLLKLNVSVNDLFMNQYDLKTKITKQISEIEIDFTTQKEHLKEQFKALYKLAEQTEKSFHGAVAAQERKQIKGLEKLEKRLLKAQKRKLSDHLERVTAIQDELFPSHSLQERQLNFSEFYLESGDDFLPLLMDTLEPLKSEFLVLTI